MRWERVVVQGGDGPGKIWGHTCNAVQGGRLLYVFGGFGADNRQTNKVHVFDTVHRIWSEPLMQGALPSPRDSHSCTTIGDKLFVFGGTNERECLNDLHILDTSSNTWISIPPNLRGDRPSPREGHTATLCGKQLFIFGGYGRRDDADIYCDDVYVLNTETFVWRLIVPSGPLPNRRAAQSYSSWNGKIIVIGGQDTSGFIPSDVHILDTDTLVWSKLNTSGQILPLRTEHTTISLGNKQLVFGGIANDGSLFDDVYVLDVAAGTWSKVTPTGDGPSARFSAAGDFLYPHRRGVLVLVGGCDDNFQPLEDMYYLHTGLAGENEQYERRIETLSLMEKLTLNCHEQQALDAIENAVKMATAHEIISKFPEQYQIHVGEGGLRLCGGQQHRIAIARVLLMNPTILLLDEARSALDAESKYLFQDAMNSLMEGRTVLVIAHRLSTVKNANDVAVVSDAQIVESGTHDDDLLNKNGIHTTLVRRHAVDGGTQNLI